MIESLLLWLRFHSRGGILVRILTLLAFTTDTQQFAHVKKHSHINCTTNGPYLVGLPIASRMCILQGMQFSINYQQKLVCAEAFYVRRARILE